MPPPEGPNSFNFMQFLRKFGKIVCWRPPLPGSWRPLLGEILDPPLLVLECTTLMHVLRILVSAEGDIENLGNILCF